LRLSFSVEALVTNQPSLNCDLFHRLKGKVAVFSFSGDISAV